MSLQEVSEIYPYSIEFTSGNIEIPNYPKKIDFSMLDVDDEKAIVSAQEKDLKRVLCNVFSTKINPQNKIKVEDLIYEDFIQLVLFVRGNSIDTVFEYSIICPHCGTPAEIQVDISKLKHKNIKNDYREPFIVEVDGKDLALRLPRVKDYIYADSQPKEMQDIILNLCAMNIDDKSYDELMSLRKNLSINKQSYAEKFRDIYGGFGIDLNTVHKCGGSGCGRNLNFEIPFLEGELFRHKTISENDFRNAIRHG